MKNDTAETSEIAASLHKAAGQLKDLTNEQKATAVRSMPRAILRQTYKLIACKGPVAQCLQVVEALNQRIELEPDTARECGDQETLDYFVKMLKKYKRIE